LEIVGKQTSDHTVINAHTLSPLALHVDDVFRGLIVGRRPVTLLRMRQRDEHQDRRGCHGEDSRIHFSLVSWLRDGFPLTCPIFVPDRYS
jgi:hypothetical protein